VLIACRVLSVLRGQLGLFTLLTALAKGYLRNHWNPMTHRYLLVNTAAWWRRDSASCSSCWFLSDRQCEPTPPCLDTSACANIMLMRPYVTRNWKQDSKTWMNIKLSGHVQSCTKSNETSSGAWPSLGLHSYDAMPTNSLNLSTTQVVVSKNTVPSICCRSFWISCKALSRVMWPSWMPRNWNYVEKLSWMDVNTLYFTYIYIHTNLTDFIRK